jgi:hypothetical protein
MLLSNCYSKILTFWLGVLGIYIYKYNILEIIWIFDKLLMTLVNYRFNMSQKNPIEILDWKESQVFGRQYPRRYRF